MFLCWILNRKFYLAIHLKNLKLKYNLITIKIIINKIKIYFITQAIQPIKGTIFIDVAGLKYFC